MLKSGCYLTVPPHKALKSDVVKDSTEVQTTEDSVSLSLPVCASPGSQLKEGAAWVGAGCSQHVPELPGTRNRDMHRNKGKASSALGWLCCVWQRQSQTSMVDPGPQHSLPMGHCPAATTEREQECREHLSEGPEGLPVSGSFCDNAACVLDACLHLSLLITCSLRKDFQDTLLRGSISYTSEEKKKPT